MTHQPRRTTRRAWRAAYLGQRVKRSSAFRLRDPGLKRPKFRRRQLPEGMLLVRGTAYEWRAA